MKCSILSPVVVCSAVILASALALAKPALARKKKVLATGQTTAYQARNNGDLAPVDVPDDGTLQRGAPLKYKLLKDGTVQDLNTSLIWEVKCIVLCPTLHQFASIYPWTGDGSHDTIWDWLDQINAEGGTGYAGHHDWRIPNRRELESLVDAQRFGAAINPIFGATASSDYWSSTTVANSTSNAWVVNFGVGAVNDTNAKTTLLFVRAVRGGPK